MTNVISFDVLALNTMTMAGNIPLSYILITPLLLVQGSKDKNSIQFMALSRQQNEPKIQSMFIRYETC